MIFQPENFDITKFEAQWEELSEQDKADLVAQSVDLDPGIAIVPILKGLSSFQFSIRNNARKALKILQSTIAAHLKDPLDQDARQKGLYWSDKVSYRLYAHLDSSMPLNDQTFYLKALLNTRGKGALYAFKAVYLQRIPLLSAKKILLTLPEVQRMNFIDKFLQAGPSIRFRYGAFIGHLLKTLKDRNTVIHYYAHLFDNGRMADPVLLGLEPYLTDPGQIELREMRSAKSDQRILGLKAYVMTVDRIPERVMYEFLQSENDKSVRSVLYRIIENSAFGTYPEAFNPLLELLGEVDENERFDAVKAMFITGKLPIYSVLDIIKDNFPDLIEPLIAQICALSRISFLVIQDIALNSTYYEKNHRDINLACIFGIVKKRPERVVKLLRQFDNTTDDGIRLSITGFIEKAKKYLSDEKQDISAPFDEIAARIEAEKNIKKSFIKSLFVSEAQKKINLLLNNQDSSIINFDSQPISDTSFNGLSFRQAALYFSNSTISNCDLSSCRFLNTYWKNCVFYNVDMAGAEFDSGNFDGAVFINVNAKGVKFTDCSFENARFYNCNFNQAAILQANLIGSEISKSAFNSTDLSGSSLSFSKLSAVSFVNASIEQADFSGVKSRFSRFPNGFKATSPFVDIDYNFRAFQLEMTDLPLMDTPIIKRLNMLLFSEFIHYGEYKFATQNQMSLLTAFDIFSTRQGHLFHIIPYLLHENAAFPGIEKPFDQNTPCGIFDYAPDAESVKIFQDYLKPKQVRVRKNNNPAIEGLFTIGSIGSLAQTTESDIDYWVCIDARNFTDTELDLFREKLNLLEAFSLKHFSIQVTFFIVDILKAQNNDFGDTSIESSGSAQARLLKEEFYRTMIHVAGKLPLWAVLPTPISINYYNRIKNEVSDLPNIARFIDLGDIHAISTGEYFGASIWQMFKWLKSPFKSVIKMALLEKYIYEYGKNPLLCNQYKDKWMNAGVNTNPTENDSYFILLDGLVRYYQEQFSPASVRILLTCFFLKLGISREDQIENTLFGLRKVLLEKCLYKWGWQRDTVFEIGNFKSWPYKEIAQLSNTIENYMVTKYKTVNNAFEQMLHTGSQISPEDKTVLGRKVLIEFSTQPDKVGKVLLISRSDRHFAGLHLKYIKQRSGIGTWELINRNAKALQTQEEVLIAARTIEEIAAWLINNGLYNELTVISLVPNPTYVTHDDIKKLFSALHDFLRPVLKSDVGFDQLLEKNRIEHLFISINFYAPKKQVNVTEYTAVYLNSWGEMFCKSAYFKNSGVSLETMKKDLLKRLGIKKFPLNTVYYFSKGVVRHQAL